MNKRLKEWCKRHPLKTAIILTAVTAGFTIMWVVVALGPDSLLNEDCHPLQRSCIETHEAAWFRAAFIAPFAVLFGVCTWRLARARNRGRVVKEQEQHGDAQSLSPKR